MTAGKKGGQPNDPLAKWGCEIYPYRKYNFTLMWYLLQSHSYYGKEMLLDRIGGKMEHFCFMTLCVNFLKMQRQIVLWPQQQHECPKWNWTYTCSDHDDQIFATNTLSCFCWWLQWITKRTVTVYSEKLMVSENITQNAKCLWVENGKLNKRKISERHENFYCLYKDWLTK